MDNLFQAHESVATNTTTKKIQIYFRLGCIFKKHLLSVKSADVVPFIVFDGLLLPGKAGEVEQRQRFELANCSLSK